MDDRENTGQITSNHNASFRQLHLPGPFVGLGFGEHLELLIELLVLGLGLLSVLHLDQKIVDGFLEVALQRVLKKHGSSFLVFNRGFSS